MSKKTRVAAPHRKVGDQVVYPRGGIGTITDIEPLTYGKETVDVYVIRFTGGSIGRVPVGKAKSNGLRKLISKNKTDEVMAILGQEPQPVPGGNHERQAQVLEERVNSYDPVALAEVIRDTFIEKTEKGNTLGYARLALYEQALIQLAREIALVRKTTNRRALALMEKKSGRKLTWLTPDVFVRIDRPDVR